MFYLVPVPKQFVDFSGVPYSGGSVTVYVHGTTDKAKIYAEAGSSVLLHNPCQLDSDGAWKCFVPADTPLDYIVQDRDGNVVASYMNIVMPMIDSAVTKGYVDSQDQLRDRNFALNYDPTRAYLIEGTYVMNGGRLYKSAVVIDEPEEWNADHWTECTVTDELDAKIAAETSRAQTAEASARTEVVQGENCSIEKTTAADGHDVYTVNADGKPQIPADWEQQDSGKPDYIKNKPNLGLKADKVQGATAGNLASLDASGNLTDSGKKAADFKTKQTAVTDPTADGNGLSFIDSITQNANGEITPHKKSVQDGTTAQKGVVQLNNAINSTSTTEAATPKAVKDAYDALNNKIVARAVFLSQAEWAVQSQIPGDPAKVYYVENGTGEDAYTVYVWKESTSEYVEVDESSIDLDGYWHDGPNTSGNGNVVTDISLGNDGVPQVVKGITALTQHQTVTDNNPTLAWGSTSTVGTVGSTNLLVTMPSNPASGKLDTTGNASDTTATFTKASGDTSATVSGSKLSVLFTAISSFFASLKALAFKDKVSTGDISDDAITAAKVKDNETLPVNISGSSNYVLPFIINKEVQTTNVWAKVATASVSAWYGYSITFQAGFSGYGGTVDYVAEISVGYKTVGGGAYGDYTLFIYRRNYSSTAILDSKLVRNGNTLELWVKDGITDTALFLVPVYHQGFLPNYADSNDRSKQLTDSAFTTYIADKTKYDATVRTTAYIPGFSQVGSTTIPVYVDTNGQVKQCTPSQMSVSSATTATNYASGGGIDSALSGKADKANITGATKCKITYSSQGIVTAGNDLSASDIPSLATSKITSGTFGTSFIADDAITANKVKDNETLPVNISGSAATAENETTWSPSYIRGKLFDLTWEGLRNDIIVSARVSFVYGSNYPDVSETFDILVRFTGTTASITRTDMRVRSSFSCLSTCEFGCRLNNGKLEVWGSHVQDPNAQYISGSRVVLNFVSHDYFVTVGRTFVPSQTWPTMLKEVKDYEIAAYVKNGNLPAGSPSTPVYVGANGQVQPCTPSSMSVGNAKTWDSWKIVVDAFGTSADTLYFY